jgi:sugar (pentulose or hexulose) kinase
MTPVIAILDVGKTNKKLFLFNQQYEIVWERSENFEETVDDDGDPCEDLHRLTHWTLAAVREVLALPQFDVQALNFSTYGASLVYLNAEGRPIGHLYNYLKPLPDAVRKQFYAQYGPVESLSVQTASPALDSLNSGLMLYRIKHDKPKLFRRIWYALHLPQYLSYLFTRQMLADLTSLGCHTMLWDFARQQYHPWVEAEGLTTLLGNLFPGDRAMNALMVETKPDLRPLRVGVGLHDSSAALIPYLASFTEPFVLISTGTWCISMNPFNEHPLTAEELQYDCLCYMHYRGKPVKASRLFAGHEHEQQTKRLAAHYHVPADYYKQVRYDAALIAQLREDHEPLDHTDEGGAGGIIPAAPKASLTGSVFAGRALADYPDYETAYHQLMLDIMAQQVVSTALVLHQSPVSRLFVDGGFSKNPIYMNLLAAAFPQMEVWAASVAQATALGAALAFHDQWNPESVPADLISLSTVQGSRGKVQGGSGRDVSFEDEEV